MPGFGKGFAFVNKFEPRLSISGPLKRDRLLLGQYFQYRFARTPGQEPARAAAAGPRQLRLVHAARRGVVVAPCADRRGDLFPAQDHQRHAVDLSPAGDHAEVHAGGVLGRPGRSADPVGQRRPRNHRGRAASSRSTRRPQGELPMVYAPQGQSGNFFNRQERNVRSLQVVEALTVSKDGWAGQHVFKVGARPPALALRRRRTISQQLDVVRLDGSLAERTTYRAATGPPAGRAAPSSRCSSRIAGGSTTA